MKVAIPHWQGRVSPVLDSAGRCYAIELTGVGESSRGEVALQAISPMQRAQEIAALHADLLICGAVSRPLAMALESAGVTFRSDICGRIDEVLDALVAGRLDEDTYQMPGCCGRRRRRRGMARRGGGRGHRRPDTMDD
jgi:predicted Fe-Mo cluster-binding NifX family protein